MTRLKVAPEGGYKSAENSLRHLRPIIVACLKAIGKDERYCELCEQHFDKPLTIHHKKYDGATLYDLCYACHSCQTRAENVGLA